jgi:hypothetical protein
MDMRILITDISRGLAGSVAGALLVLRVVDRSTREMEDSEIHVSTR